MSYTPGPLPEPDGTAEANKVKCADGWGYEYDEVEAWSRHLVEAYTAAEVARAVAAERERWVRRVEDAFRLGFCSPETYNDTPLNTADEAWKSARDELLSSEAIRADPQRLQGKGE